MNNRPPTAASPNRIALIDQHALLTDALRVALRETSDIEVVGVAHTADEARRLVVERHPQLAIVDVLLPGQSAFDLAPALQAQGVPTEFVFCLPHLCDVLLEQAVRLRPRGVFLKQESLTVLQECVRAVCRGENYYSASVQDSIKWNPISRAYEMRRANRLSMLTTRQLEVLRHLAVGRSVKEVAKEMHLSEKSVDSHKYRIMHRLDIHDRVELARFAIREGLTTP